MNEKLLRAVLVLLIADYESRPTAEAARVELLLASSGLGYKEIAELVGKKPDAVRMLLKRNQQPPKNL